MFTLRTLCRLLFVVACIGTLFGFRSYEMLEKAAATRKPIISPETAGEYLSKFSAPARQRLEKVLFDDRFEGVIDSEVVQDVVRLEGTTENVDQFMIDMLPLARLYSWPPTSGFKVGAVCDGKSGRIYFGANLEIDNAPLGFTIHAEQSSVANAFAHGERSLRSLAVTNAPCGHCRQFLNELATGSALQVTIKGKAKSTLGSLLPEAFGPSDLGVHGGLLDQKETPLVVQSVSSDPVAESAVRAASRSYAPYTHSYSGVALRLKNGTIVAGSYVENAAYNPSLPPLLMAIDRLRFSGGEYSDISQAYWSKWRERR